MPDNIILRPMGRISEPNYTLAPQGAMLKAENCIIRKPGVLEPLPSFIELEPGHVNVDGLGVWHISPEFSNGAEQAFICILWGANPTIQYGARSTVQGFSNAQELIYADLGALITPPVRMFDHGDGLTFGVMWMAHDSLYLSDRRGSYKLENTDGTFLTQLWDRGWMGIRFTENTTAANKFLDLDNVCQYKLVARWKDSNGLQRWSAPSRGFWHEATQATNLDLTVSLHHSMDQSASLNFEAVEIYRSKQYPDNTTIPNVYYYVGEIQADAFSISSPIITTTYTDTLEDSQLTTTLYTNTNQQGATAFNVSPPEALYHAHYRGYEFWGNVTLPEVFTIRAHVTTGGLFRTDSGVDCTNGTPNLSELSIADVRGAYISSEGTNAWPDSAYIESQSGTDAVISEDATITSTAVDVLIHDTLYIVYADGTTDRISLFRATGYDEGNDFDRGWAFDQPETAPNYTYLVDCVIRRQSGPDIVEMTFASRHRPGRMGVAQAWIVQASNTANVQYITPYADLNTAGHSPTSGGTEPEPALQREGMIFSKYLQPEHVTFQNFRYPVPNEEILGLAALRDRLIILSTGGVYALTGTDPQSFRVDPLDTTVNVIGGRTTAVMGDAVYTLSDRGLLQITAGGVRNLTDGVIDDWLHETPSSLFTGSLQAVPRIESIRKYMRENDGYHPPGLFAVADEAHREYYLMCNGARSSESDLPAQGPIEDVLVFNATTGAFTTLNTGDSGISALSYSRGDQTKDYMEPGLVLCQPSALSYAGVYLLDNSESTKPHSFWDQKVYFRAMHLGDPTHVKRWNEICWDTEGNYDWENATVDFQDGEEGTVITQAITRADRELRIWPPRNVVRTPKLVCGLTGKGFTVHALRASFVSSGKRAPA